MDDRVKPPGQDIRIITESFECHGYHLCFGDTQPCAQFCFPKPGFRNFIGADKRPRSCRSAISSLQRAGLPSVAGDARVEKDGNTLPSLCEYGALRAIRSRRFLAVVRSMTCSLRGLRGMASDPFPQYFS